MASKVSMGKGGEKDCLVVNVLYFVNPNFFNEIISDTETTFVKLFYKVIIIMCIFAYIFVIDYHQIFGIHHQNCCLHLRYHHLQ